MTDLERENFTRGAKRGIAAAVRDPEMRRDALQNAYIALLTRAPWAGDSDLSTWAFRVGLNCARELLRRESRHLRCESIAEDAPAPDTRERADLLLSVAAAAAGLPPTDRAAIAEYRQVKMPADSASKSRRRRALVRLRARLGVARG